MLAIRTQRRIGAIGIVALIISFIWILQLCILSRLTLFDVQCNLALTFIIVWSVTWGSPVKAPTLDELRLSTWKEVMLRQILSGSISGALLGAAFAALYNSILPIYPICYPLVGWTAGYFCLRNFNRAIIFCIPLVFVFTFMSELIMAAQLYVVGRPGVLENLVRVSLIEASLNSLLAPFIFFPMRGRYEFLRFRELSDQR